MLDRISSRALFVVLLSTPLGVATPVPASAQSLPNLVVDGVQGPRAAVAGSSIEVSFSAGTREAAARASGAILLTQGGTSLGAVELARFGPVDFSPPFLSPRTERANLPMDRSGIFRLAVRMDPDGSVAESNENDNLAFADLDIRIRAPQAGLRVGAVQSSSSRIRVGQALDVTFEVENLGAAASSAVTAVVVVGRDRVATTSDRELGRINVAALAAGGVAQPSLRVVLPADLGAGEWWLGVVLDPSGSSLEVRPSARSAVTDAPLVVVRDELVLLTTTLPDATHGRGYDLRLAARGGDGSYVFNFTGALPAGMALGAEPRLTGVPTAVGRFDLELTVRSDGREDSAPVSLVVQETGLELQVATSTLPEAFAGRLYGHGLVAGGGVPPYRWSTSDPLPSSLALSEDGVLSGVPDDVGVTRFTAAVRDGQGGERSARLTLVVSLNPTVLIQTATVAAVVGEPLDQPLQAVGGLSPLRWVAETQAPPGLELTPDGRLRGRPTRAGPWPFQVSATDATSPGVRDLAFVQVEVADPGALRITSGPMPEVPRFTLFEHVLTAGGGTPPYRWSVVPGDFLPPDFFLVPGPERERSADTGVIYGQAVAGALSAFSVRVEDAYGRRDEQPLVFFVAAAGAASAAETPGDGGCSASSQDPGASALLLLLGLLHLRRRRRRS